MTALPPGRAIAASAHALGTEGSQPNTKTKPDLQRLKR